MSDHFTVNYMPGLLLLTTAMNSVTRTCKAPMLMAVLLTVLFVPLHGTPLPLRAGSALTLKGMMRMPAGDISINDFREVLKKTNLIIKSNTKRAADVETSTTPKDDGSTCSDGPTVDICNEGDLYSAFRRIYDKPDQESATVGETAKLNKSPFRNDQLPPFRYVAVCNFKVSCMKLATGRATPSPVTMPYVFLQKDSKATSKKAGCAPYRVCTVDVRVGCPCTIGPSGDILASTPSTYSPL